MLIFTRRPGESFYIGEGPDRITVTIIEVVGNRVRIGIEAPRSVAVHREEIWLRIHGGEGQRRRAEPDGNK